MKGKFEFGVSYNYDRNVSLTAEEEFEYGKRIMEGDKEAVNELAISHMGFGASYAYVYSRKFGVPVRDIMQAIFVDGLLKAARKYDYRRGFRFKTYASYWVRQAAFRFVQSVKCDLDESAVSLFDSGYHGEESDDYEVIDHIADESSPDPQVLLLSMELRNQVLKLISEVDLSGNERKVLYWKFGLNGKKQRSYEDIAIKLNLKKSKVKEIEAAVLRKLKRFMAVSFE